ncbi:DUF4238 domain-containing protein [Rhizobium sp. KAs_5_22]|uniref:DUF4238 domain-containing protein n=1 Tax=Ciceribacter selenitireducens TaxID=448181 RepID=UPI0004BB9FE6|nr:DUF4238 domain-containing protein [Rhizobium sp. KAs_5_22]
MAASRTITKDNHYVSRGYLKQWQSSPGKIFVYRLLVSNANVPLWKETSIASVGFQEHLYTRHIAGADNDEMERWFSRDFETPADGPLQRAVNDEPLTSDDWRTLVRYLAMHDMRPPARLIEHLNSASANLSNALSSVLAELPDRLHAGGISTGEDCPAEIIAPFPLRLSVERQDSEEATMLKVETAVCRASWLWSLNHLLNKTIRILHSHKWTIMRPSAGMSWFTSDKPVMRLNYYDGGSYDFRGGWGRSGGEILFPISPQHMMYTRIGHKPPVRGSRFSREQTQLLRRLIAEHAHRYVFGSNQDPEVSIFRVRNEDHDAYKAERNTWKNWHYQQVETEKRLLRGDSDSFLGSPRV